MIQQKRDYMLKKEINEMDQKEKLNQTFPVSMFLIKKETNHFIDMQIIYLLATGINI